MTIGSDANFVHGTCIKSSLILPDTKLKGNCSSCSRTCKFSSKLRKQASPPQSETLKKYVCLCIFIN